MSEDGSAGCSPPSSVLRHPSSVLRIWLCADDYGIAPGVNQAIRDLIGRGRINATSAMVVAPSLTHAEARALASLDAGERRAAIGLHFTLTAPFRPLSAGFTPLADGAFLPLPALMRAALLRRLDRQRLAAEVAAQLSAFAAAFGRAPDFVDGHQHVHLFPQVREEVLAGIAAHAPAAWVRQCGSTRGFTARLADRKGLVIDVFSRAVRRRARRQGVATNPGFAGTHSFLPSADFAALFPGFLDRL